jgi:uncharacterized protein (DUF58 family)
MHQKDDINESVRKIELYTRRLLSGALVGSSRSAQKGVGLDFDQLREYTIGDDPRIIDWLGSARSQKLLVKQYQEERNRTILLVVDGSTSMQFGLESKFERATWIAGLIAMIGGYGADKVGLMVYTDTVEWYVPPRAGITHVRSLIRDLYAYTPQKITTDVRPALRKLGALKERSLVFLVSDCIDDHLAHSLRTVRRHDILVACCLDEREYTVPAAGIWTVQDSESGTQHSVYLSKQHATTLAEQLATRHAAQSKALTQSGITVLNSMKKDTFVRDLLLIMRRRMRY